MQLLFNAKKVVSKCLSALFVCGDLNGLSDRLFNELIISSQLEKKKRLCYFDWSNNQNNFKSYHNFKFGLAYQTCQGVCGLKREKRNICGSAFLSQNPSRKQIKFEVTSKFLRFRNNTEQEIIPIGLNFYDKLVIKNVL